MVTFNCIGCHDRAGVGGVDPERDRYFTGTKPALGNQGRLPPTLSHVGAKLKPEWMSEVLLRGGRQRDYLDANMPQYGEKNVGHLIGLLGRVDTLEEVILPEITNIRESKDAGYEMMGADGFSCIACHDYNGQKAGGAGALDIVNVTDRLRKNWFHLYMRDPQRFHATVIMPSYWPGGQSIRPNLLNGDPAQQIEALWNYLEDGPRAKKPRGLSRQSNELRVSDVAEMCRGRGTAGFRGIGVGYPERLNLAFDSEEMALRLLWKGAFANVNHGSFHARGGERISFPAGIPFHRLESMDDSWPYKGKTDFTFPQDQGYQFRGYDLDELRRPTFRYRYGGISVEDFFEDVPEGDGRAWFRRTFHFETPRAQELFYFRAASGVKVTRASDGAFVIDQLELRISSAHKGMVREGDPAEVLIPLTLPEGRSQLILEYRW
jgi:mono/diheme cytochrome c family protein